MNHEFKNQLAEIALRKSKPFCYSCYQTVKSTSGHCLICGSDYNMRILEGYGVEYGCEDVENFIQTES